MSDGKLHIDVHVERDFVAVEAETDDGRFAAPMSPAVAREFALRLWIAADEADGGVE